MNHQRQRRTAQQWPRTTSALAVLVLVVGLLTLPGTAGADPHSDQSHDVLIIGGTLLVHGGHLPTTGPVGELGDFNFASAHPGSVNALMLARYDTVVLSVAGRQGMSCNVGNLPAAAKADLVDFIEAGHKLIINDSECSPQDYSWLPFAFTTTNPGEAGSGGLLTIVEENLLSTSTPKTDVHYIDTYILARLTDAVGDSNVMTTFDSNWCVDMSATNYFLEAGPVQTYAKTGADEGLIIYNGMDLDFLGGGFLGDAELRKIWVQQLQQPFNPSGLPCGTTVIGITLSPETATNPVGTEHSVTALVLDLLGEAQDGIDVSFTVVSGPNAGDTGTDRTGTAGVAGFTYTGDGGVGIDVIEACFTNAAGFEVCSQTVTKEWTNRRPVADADGPYTVGEGSVVMLDGSGSFDPNGDPITYEWDLDNDGSHGDATGVTTTASYDDGPGSHTVGLRVTDSHGASDTDATTVMVNNVAPTATFSHDGPVSEGTRFTLRLTNPLDPSSADTAAGFTYSFDCGDGSGYGASTAATTAVCATDDDGVRTVKGMISDKDGGVSEYSGIVTVTNVSPSLGPLTVAPALVEVGTPVQASAACTDPGTADTHTAEWDWGDNTTDGPVPTPCNGPGSVVGSHTYAAAGVYTVRLTVTDDDGGTATEEFEYVIVYDPSVGFVTGGGWIDSPEGAYYPPDLPFFDGSYYDWFYTEEPVSLFEANEFAAELTYPTCTSGAHLTTITSQDEYDAVLPLLDVWGGWLRLGGFQDEGVVPADFGWQWVTGEPFEFAPWLPGEPNDCGLGHAGCPPASEQRLTMYADGWNDEPWELADMYSVEYEGCDAGPTGKATFGFVSKYKKGASVPTGSTEFQFHAAGLNFHSTSYDWLVVTGSNFAKFKGTGTINGEGTYKFQIWAGDNDPDTFRIKIWTEDEFDVETVFYDNGHDQAISAGSIVIHAKKK